MGIPARALLVLATVAANPLPAAFHLWQINEFYSNAAGNVQFVELTAFAGGQQFLAGHAFTSTDGSTTRTFTFPANLPGDTADKRMVIGTQGFAALGVVTPDYVVPDGFFHTSNFTFNFAEGFDVWNNSSGAMAVPTDGVLSLARNGTTAVNSPLNFAGQTKAVLPLPLQADLNGNGRSDMLWRNNQSGLVYRMLMSGQMIASQGAAYHEPNTSWTVVADADFNGDGISDLLWRNRVNGAVYLQPFSTAGTAMPGSIVHVEPSTAWRIVHTPDIDGDGKADILWWNAATGQVYAMLMNGATIAAQGTVFTEPNTSWRIAGVGDFAGTGKVNQLLWRNLESGHVYLMTVTFATGTFSQTGQIIYHEPSSSWQIIGIADFNGDLKSDILWRNASSGHVYVMLMNNGAIASQGIVYHEPNPEWQIVAQGDYDGNFKADLLWRNTASGIVYMVLMNGLAISSQGVVYAEPGSSWRLLGPQEYGSIAAGWP